MARLRFVLAAAVVAAPLFTAPSGHAQSDSADDEGQVVVNGAVLPSQTVAALGQLYRTQIRPGHYWYDRISGAWGLEGGPTVGFAQPNLPLGGPLQPDASNGTTGVFVNGRELPVLDVAALQRCLPVQPGRYWVLPNFVGGYEGGPPIFNIAAACAARRGSTQTEGYGSGGGWSGNSRTGIGAITDGEGHATVFIDGHGTSTPN